MARIQRIPIIKKIESVRESRVIAYVTSDRAPIGAQIGDDAIRPIYQRLRELGGAPRIDLFLYSRGGAIDVPWRLVTALRQAAKEWCILVPFRANSAGTLIALGADSIVMGRHGELGPIDPSMGMKRMVPGPGGQGAFVQDSVSVEDVMAYVRFVQDRCQLTEQDALASAIGKLSDRVDPVALGSVYRTHSHIRDVARRILLSRATPANEEVLNQIVQTLAEHVYAHGHAIGCAAAKNMQLPVEAASSELDGLMWDLLGVYEADLKLLEPLDAVTVVAAQDRYVEDACIAVVETADATEEFRGQIEVKAKRQLPQTLQVNLNLNLQMPAGLDLSQLPANAQQVLQQVVSQAQQAITQQGQQAVQQALNAQAPLLAAEAAFRNGRWIRSQ